MNKVFKLFVRFLKSKNIYHSYFKYLLSQNGREYRYKYGTFINPNIFIQTYCRNNPIVLIEYAFAWIETKEGLDYWHSLSNEWRKIIENIKYGRYKTFVW